VAIPSLVGQKFGCDVEQGRLIEADSSGNGRGNKYYASVSDTDTAAV